MRIISSTDCKGLDGDYKTGGAGEGTANVLMLCDVGTALVPVELPPDPLFRLGQLAVTPNAWGALERAYGKGGASTALGRLLRRHSNGDYGAVGDEDRAENDRNIDAGFIVSAFLIGPTGRLSERVWVMTEADRSATKVLLPEDW